MTGYGKFLLTFFVAFVIGVILEALHVSEYMQGFSFGMVLVYGRHLLDTIYPD